MKNLITRTITGLIYIALIVGGIFSGKEAFAAVFFIFAILAHWEFLQLAKHNNVSPPKIIAIIAGVLLYVSIALVALAYSNPVVLLINIPSIIAILMVELFRNKKIPVLNLAHVFFSLLYAVLPLAFLNFLYNIDTFIAERDNYLILLGFFIVLWINDTFAYIFGSLFGKHKLFERISPKKTWEGFIGGAVASFVFVCICLFNYGFIGLEHGISIALIIIIFGTLGDLIESMIKRHFEVKDSGSLLPGHGGILDRIDSILLAAPMVYAYLAFFSLLKQY